MPRSALRRLAAFESPYLLDHDSLPAADGSGSGSGNDSLASAGSSIGAVDWAEVFGRDAPLRVEVGVGNSPFLIEVAKHEPEFNYLGIEYSGKRVHKFLRKVDRAGVENIRMLHQNSDQVFFDRIAPGQLDHLFVNFPDPWRKERHRRKRFIRSERLLVVCNLLRIGGGFSLKTDAPAYAAEALEVLESIDQLENIDNDRGELASKPLFPFETPYEARFRQEGKPIHYFEYRKTNATEVV